MQGACRATGGGLPGVPAARAVGLGSRRAVASVSSGFFLLPGLSSARRRAVSSAEGPVCRAHQPVRWAAPPTLRLTPVAAGGGPWGREKGAVAGGRGRRRAGARAAPALRAPSPSPATDPSVVMTSDGTVGPARSQLLMRLLCISECKLALWAGAELLVHLY